MCKVLSLFLELYKVSMLVDICIVRMGVLEGKELGFVVSFS